MRAAKGGKRTKLERDVTISAQQGGGAVAEIKRKALNGEYLQHDPVALRVIADEEQRVVGAREPHVLLLDANAPLLPCFQANPHISLVRSVSLTVPFWSHSHSGSRRFVTVLDTIWSHWQKAAFSSKG